MPIVSGSLLHSPQISTAKIKNRTRNVYSTYHLKKHKEFDNFSNFSGQTVRTFIIMIWCESALWTQFHNSSIQMDFWLMTRQIKTNDIFMQFRVFLAFGSFLPAKPINLELNMISDCTICFAVQFVRARSYVYCIFA